jgi:hypothetical protein
MFALLFGAISLLYAAIGQAGGTAFLALMALASFPSNEIRPTALLLNIVAAAYSAWLFNRASLVDWIKLAAFRGGDRHNRRATLVVANHDALYACCNIGSSRDSIAILPVEPPAVPAITLVEVSRLFAEGLLIEIEGIAAI